MNIILLSGGSGKRLWPLSNNVRAKQFLKIFKLEDGRHESMVQRMYRMIREVDPSATITIATSESQVPLISDQLGDRVQVSIEPCRRDTFPAIALAVAYLHDVEGVPEDEAVVVCPVDPYVEKPYFETIVRLQEQAQHGDSNLYLMGIEPTYPSAKYGYIIPTSADAVSDVKEFKEKPTEAVASEYIGQGALWNAGVFACRLDYLLKRAETVFGNSSYNYLVQHYPELKKISFDYAVVEREPSITVVRYNGLWTDAGTWNSMAELLDNKPQGQVVMDDTCENSFIVNHLDLPVLAIGVKNIVLAAGRDGILICDKSREGELKNKEYPQPYLTE